MENPAGVGLFVRIPQDSSGEWSGKVIPSLAPLGGEEISPIFRLMGDYFEKSPLCQMGPCEGSGDFLPPLAFILISYHHYIQWHLNMKLFICFTCFLIDQYHCCMIIYLFIFLVEVWFLVFLNIFHLLNLIKFWNTLKL